MAADARRLPRDELDALFGALRRRGYELIGPRVGDGAILLQPIDGADDLPVGWTARQEAGTYRLARRDDEAVFGFAVGPHSPKNHLFAARRTVFRARHERDGLRFVEEPVDDTARAFIGLRSCELAAIAIQDRVFLGALHPDADYAARRRRNFVVAVNCGEAGGTCFCVSMDTGPRARNGFDLALTEVLEDGEHFFLVETGSDAGAEVLQELELSTASAEDLAAADACVERAARAMGRSLDTRGLREALQAQPEHPRWDEVANRCLACTNCTLVCPTCFCHTVEDTTVLEGSSAEQVRVWDSCFNSEFSELAGGGPVRATVRGRYRQWLTHKLSTWWDQFGTSGCVGCGRCITWCPVGIDITEEAGAIAKDARGNASTEET